MKTGLTRLLFSFLAVLLLLACSGGSGGGGVSKPVHGPLVVSLTKDFATFHVKWEASPKPKSLVVEATPGGVLVTTEFPIGNETEMIIYFSSKPPEMTVVSFRLMYSDGPGPTINSNTGPFPASMFGATWSNGLKLTWQRNSSVADSIRLDRVRVDGSGQPISPSVQIAELDGTVTSFLDKNGNESDSFAYTITYTSKGIPGPGVRLNANFPNLLAPGDLTVAETPQGPRLQWTNRSSRATKLEVYRAIGTGTPTNVFKVTSLSTTATEYVDTALGNTPGAFKFWLVVNDSSSVSGMESNRVLHVATPTGTGPALSFQVLDFPATWKICYVNPLWFLQSTNPPGLKIGDGSNWQHVDFPPGRFATPLVQYDGSGRLHLMHYGGNSPTLIRHYWRDSGVWSSEIVADGRYLVSDDHTNNFQFRVDSSGAVHAIWEKTIEGIEYATNAGGSWKVITIPASLQTGLDLDIDAAGHALILSRSNNVIQLLKIQDGIWSSETVPTGPLVFSYSICLLHQSIDKTSVFFDDLVTGKGMELRTVEKAGSSWGAVRKILDLGLSGTSSASIIARDSVHNQVAIVTETDSGSLVVRNGIGSEWTHTLLGLKTYGRWSAGFNSVGKLFVAVPMDMVPASDGSGVRTPVILYQEK